MAEDTKKSTAVYQNSKVRYSRLKWRWPLLVWMGFAVGGVWLYFNTGGTDRLNGVVEIIMEPVSAPEDARIEKVVVVSGQKVKAGDVIAQLDTSFLKKEIAVLKAEMDLDLRDRIRQYRSVVLGLNEEIRDLDLRSTQDQGELRVLKEEIAALEKMIGGVITRDVLTRHITRKGALEANIPKYKELMEKAKADLRVPQERLAVLLEEESGESDGDTRPSQIDLLEKRIASYTLRALRDGVVASVPMHAGEFIAAGLPVASLVVDTEPRVFAFLAEGSSIAINDGQTVRIELDANSQEAVQYEAEVVIVAPYFKSVPDRVSPLPNRFIRGREVVMRFVNEDVALLPGQSVVVRLGDDNPVDIVVGKLRDLMQR